MNTLHKQYTMADVIELQKRMKIMKVEQESITEDGVYWDSDGENIRILYMNEQWPLWLSKEDLLTMIKHLETEQAYKGTEK